MEVRARAPGKIILAGEHAVVHGSAAVAASIDRYTFVYLSLPPPIENDDKLMISLKDPGLEFSWPLGRIKELMAKFVASPTPFSPTSCSLEAMNIIATLIGEHNIPEAKVAIAAGVSAFLWLYISIQGYKPGKVVVNSELPLGAGLGSSAAFNVSLSAALLALSDSVNVDLNHQGWLMFKEKDLDLVNKWAYVGEQIIHGKPSGIDNTVSTYGNLIKYKSGELTRLTSNLPIKMLITNTKVSRDTKTLVAGVSGRKIRNPEAMSFIFKAVDNISNDVASVLQSPGHDDSAVTEKENKLRESMEINQGLLQSMGVSHASIETVRSTTSRYNLITKLTGAGGGGCTLTLLPTLLSQAVVDEVIAELEACGFQCLIAGIGGKGLQISFDSST